MAGGWQKLSLLLVLAAALGAAGEASAQAARKAAAKPAEDGEAAPKKGTATAGKSLDAGIKSFDGGKYDQAISALTSAITSGGLQSAQMAKALYYRGVAYRKQGKPAQAISDLTSALWLKGGLSDTERAAAMDNRAGAYREAGLIEPTQVETARTTAAAGKPAAVSEKPQRQAPAAAQPAQASASSWSSTTSTAAKPAGAQAAAAAPVAAAPATTSSVPSQPSALLAARAAREQRADEMSSAFNQPPGPRVPLAVREKVATAPADSEAIAPPPPQKKSGGMLSSLFGDLSLGGSAAKRAEPAPPAPAAAAGASAAAGWAGATTVQPGSAAAGKQVAAAQPQPPAAPLPKAEEGRFRLQVAAVRTRQEADQVATRLRAQHAKELKSRAVEIDEATLASVGTFYRVRVGPYADANEPRNLCVKLRQKGYDCLVVGVSH